MAKRKLDPRYGRPSMKYLNRHVIPLVAPRWYDLGLELLETQHERELEIIEAGHGSRPALRDLARHVIPSVETDWYNLGSELLDPKYKNELNTIEADTRYNAATSCRKMFTKWLNTDELASWDKLIKALRVVQLNEIANDIEQLLLQGDARDTRGAVTSSYQPGSSSRVGDDTPTLRDLRSNFVTQYAAHWEKLGLELGLKEYRIVNISKNNARHPRSAEESCAAVLEQWLKETPSPTWSKLDDAVKNIKLSLSTSHDKEVDNAVDWLSGHMKGRYCSMRLRRRKEEKDFWPPIKTNSYVALAIVHQKELQTRKVTTSTIYLRTKGDIHEIPHTIGTDKLTDITQIFDPVSGRVPNSILIEGNAGIGKTTFVKEMCIEWAEGKLLTSDKLVLLLLLRDPNVQKITNERKLIEHFTKSSSKVEQMSGYLQDNRGAGVTLIIDGFDELNTTLRQESFFRNLIEKRCLSEAKIVVTSRPSASACLHGVIDRRLEILGFEQSSRNQYVTEALQDSPSKLEKLQRYFQQYPNIDAICYIPLIMSIIVFLCISQPDELPPTATKMYASFILHTICHYLKRAGKIPEDKVINKLEQFPPVVYIALQDLEKTAFDGLVRDKIVFTVEELPVFCWHDPTCYGLLQSTECYSAEEVGTPTQSFNFLHLGIQEYFAAKYVTTLPEEEVYTLLKESFIVTDYDPNPDSISVRLSGMWILYCGITRGQCKTLRHYLKITGPSQQQSTSDQRIYITRTISQDILMDPVKVLYLFQCFQEAQDNELCEVLSKSFDSGKINISKNRLLPHQVVSLGFFLSRSHWKWKELNLWQCDIGDHGMSIIHQYLCVDKTNKQEITKINLGENDLTAASSHHIADIISHLRPHTLWLDDNNITNVRDISTAVINTSTVKVLHMWNNGLIAQEAVAISDMMICLEELNISKNEFGDHGAELLSEGITNSKTLRILQINDNNIGPSGTTAIANALTINTSLQQLNISYNNIGPSGTTAIAYALTTNTSLQQLYISNNNIGPSGTTAIANVLTINTSLQQLDINDNNIGPSGTTAIAYALTTNTSLQQLYISNNNIGPSGTTAIANALAINVSLQEVHMAGISIGQDEATALGNAITKNKMMETLKLGYDDDDDNHNNPYDETTDKESAMIIINSLYHNNTIIKLIFPNIKLHKNDEDVLTKKAEIVNSTRTLCNNQIIDLKFHFIHLEEENNDYNGKNLWTQEDLKELISKPTKEAILLPKNIKDKVLQSVVVWLVTVNTNEILAAQSYLRELDDHSCVYKFSINIHQSEQQSKEIIYYIGNYGYCPAAICDVSPSFNPYDSENNVSSITHELFPHLGAVISVGVAHGIAGKTKISDVLISSKVICCNKAMDKLQTVTVSQQLTDIFDKSIVWDNHMLPKLDFNPSVKSGVILSCLFDIPSTIPNEIDSEAIGIENGKANLFANVQHSRINIAIVKAISGFGESSLYQPTAAVLAAYLVFKCLSDGQALRVLTAKKKSLEMIQQAKDKNLTIKVRHAKILFCGAAHAGKTSFSRLLQGKPHIYDYESTQIGETRQVLSDKVSLESSKWVVLDRELETEKLMMCLYQLLQKSENQREEEKTFNNYTTTSTVKLASNKPPAELVQSIREAEIQATETKSGNQLYFDDVPETQSSISVLDSQPSELLQAKEKSSIENLRLSVEKEMADFSISELRDKIPDEWDLFTLLDSGGQPEFIKMLPAINNFAAITFVVLNMCEGRKCIDDNVNAQYSCKDHDYPEYKLKYTYKELIECLLSSVRIATTVKERKFFDDRFIKKAVVKWDAHPNPVVCFIGTHADELKNKINVLNYIDEEISRLIVMEKESQAFITWKDFLTQKYLIPIDNTTTEGNTKNSDIQRNTLMAVDEIHKESNKLLKEKTQYEIPISWFILELEIRKHCKINKMVCLFLHEIKAIWDKIMPNSKSMDIEMIKEVMKFYHMFGTLLYFHEVKGMDDIVITDPQWLFNNLTKIITFNFDKNFLHCGAEIHDMKYKGICNEKLLERLTLDLRRGVNMKSFLELLVYLKVIARLNNHQYFIPSVLSLSAVESDEPFGKAVAYTTNGKEIKMDPLFITSKFETIPRGLFGFLIVQLLQENQNLHNKNDPSIKIFDCCFADRITFQIKPRWYFTLTDKISYLMLQVRVEGENQPSYHCHVQKMVTKALGVVCDKFDWQLSNCRYGFLCKKCTSKEHPSILPNELPIASRIEDYTECIHDKIMEFKEEQRIWFEKVDGYKQKLDGYLQDDETNIPHQAQPVPELPVDTSSEIMNKKPEMADLNDIVIPKVMNQWEELAEGFRYDDEVIDKIKRQHHNDTEKCCREFFRDWRRTDNGNRAGPKTWSTLFNIIEKYISIASDIREDMITKVKKLKL